VCSAARSRAARPVRLRAHSSRLRWSGPPTIGPSGRVVPTGHRTSAGRSRTERSALRERGANDGRNSVVSSTARRLEPRSPPVRHTVSRAFACVLAQPAGDCAGCPATARCDFSPIFAESLESRGSASTCRVNAYSRSRPLAGEIREFLLAATACRDMRLSVGALAKRQQCRSAAAEQTLGDEIGIWPQRNTRIRAVEPCRATATSWSWAG
jgi:hypothetical protein